MGGTIHPGVLMEKSPKHVWQWYWDFDWLNQKYKAIYFGPRLSWMKLFRKEKNEKKLDTKKRRRYKKIKSKS